MVHIHIKQQLEYYHKTFRLHPKPLNSFQSCKCIEFDNIIMSNTNNTVDDSQQLNSQDYQQQQQSQSIIHPVNIAPSDILNELLKQTIINTVFDVRYKYNYYSNNKLTVSPQQQHQQTESNNNICQLYNSSDSCTTHNCPFNHQCSYCLNNTHTVYNCSLIDYLINKLIQRIDNIKQELMTKRLREQETDLGVSIKVEDTGNDNMPQLGNTTLSPQQSAVNADTKRKPLPYNVARAPHDKQATYCEACNTFVPYGDDAHDLGKKHLRNVTLLEAERQPQPQPQQQQQQPETSIQSQPTTAQYTQPDIIALQQQLQSVAQTIQQQQHPTTPSSLQPSFNTQQPTLSMYKEPYQTHQQHLQQVLHPQQQSGQHAVTSTQSHEPQYVNPQDFTKSSDSSQPQQMQQQQTDSQPALSKLLLYSPSQPQITLPDLPPLNINTPSQQQPTSTATTLANTTATNSPTNQSISLTESTSHTHQQPANSNLGNIDISSKFWYVYCKLLTIVGYTYAINN